VIGGVGSVRGFTAMIATEGIFVWCTETPTSACKHWQQCLGTVSTLSTRRFKNL
jgi:heme A synthase